VADLERAAALVPAASEVQNHLGLAYAAAGRDADARAAFERAVELDCENAAAGQNLRAARRRAAGAQP
jgi:Flp pilus assembly protein TadD